MLRLGENRKETKAGVERRNALVTIIAHLSRQPVIPHRRRLRTGAPPSTNAPGTGSKAIVVAHDELRLHLVYGVHRDADDDQQRRPAEEEIDPQAIQQPAGKISID